MIDQQRRERMAVAAILPDVSQMICGMTLDDLRLWPSDYRHVEGRAKALVATVAAALRFTPAEPDRDPDGYVRRGDLYPDGTPRPRTTIFRVEPRYGDCVPFYGCEPAPPPPQQDPVAWMVKAPDGYTELWTARRKGNAEQQAESLGAELIPLIRAPEESSE